MDRLLAPAAYPHPVTSVTLIETHISWVFLTGDYVYKVKKPVNFGFLDFSSLERRRHFCEEEVRLNRRFAPTLYLNAVPIVGPPTAARILRAGEVGGDGGDGEPIEWAVRLRQFDEAGRLDRLLDGGGLSAQGCTELASEMARQAVGTDASDASVDIVRAQFAAREPILPDEFARTSDGDLLESLIVITGADLEHPEFVQRLAADLLARSGS